MRIIMILVKNGNELNFGYDKDGIKYEATGIMGHGEIVEIYTPMMLLDD